MLLCNVIFNQHCWLRTKDISFKIPSCLCLVSCPLLFCLCVMWDGLRCKERNEGCTNWVITVEGGRWTHKGLINSLNIDSTGEKTQRQEVKHLKFTNRMGRKLFYTVVFYSYLSSSSYSILQMRKKLCTDVISHTFGITLCNSVLRVNVSIATLCLLVAL